MLLYFAVVVIILSQFGFHAVIVELNEKHEIQFHVYFCIYYSELWLLSYASEPWKKLCTNFISRNMQSNQNSFRSKKAFTPFCLHHLIMRIFIAYVVIFVINNMAIMQKIIYLLDMNYLQN